MKRRSPVTAGVIATALLAAVTPPALAQQEGQPPTAATGADVPTSYFGPPASEVDRKLVGPVQLLRSGKLEPAALAPPDDDRRGRPHARHGAQR